jgi:hypothetical protein
MTLARIRDDVRQELSMLLVDQTIDDGLIDHCLHQALNDLAKHLPTRRAIVTLTATGQVQNLTSLAPDIYSLTEIYYPYHTTDPLHRNCYPVTVYSPDRVEFYYCEPQVNDQIEIVYHAIYTILDLRLSATHTLPTNCEHAIILSACAHILMMIDTQRQLAATDPKTTPKSLLPLAKTYSERAISEAQAMSNAAPLISWPYIGL